MTVKLFQQIGILDDSLNNTEKLANVRDRGEKPLFVFVITKVGKKRLTVHTDLLSHL